MSEERRRRILACLRESTRPITGSELSVMAGVSRQIVVQDVALIRARGEEVVATPQGYVLAERLTSAAPRAVFACRHGRDETEDELTTLVDLGIRVIDVVVEHPIYGDLRGLLALESREDVRNFVVRLRESEAGLLLQLTKGIHLHTVEASRPELLERAREALRAKGYLLTTADDPIIA